MWRGFTRALVRYGLGVCDTWVARGHADATRAALLEFTAGRVPDRAALRAGGELPPWLGDLDLHLSHRSALLRKDPEHYRSAFPDVPADLPYEWPVRSPVVLERERCQAENAQRRLERAADRQARQLAAARRKRSIAAKRGWQT